MPTYSYRCESCNKSFTQQMTIADHDTARVKCPKCASRKARQQFGPFSVKTSDFQEELMCTPIEPILTLPAEDL